MSASKVDPTVFAVAAATPALLRAFYAGLPAAVLHDPVDDGWSPLHVLAHLLDTEDVIVGRMRRIVEEQRPFIPSIDAPARLEASGYLLRDVETLLRDFADRRAEGVAWLRSMTPAQLARLGDHDEAGQISAADHAHQWAYHDLMHLKQAATMLQTRLERGMGNTRRFYFDV
jgi:hypothetical protein